MFLIPAGSSTASWLMRIAQSSLCRAGLVIATGLAFVARPTAAQNVPWSNTATDFNDGASWSGGQSLTSANTAVFSGTPVAQPNLTASITVQALRFQSSGWTLSSSGGTVTVLSTSGGNQALFLNGGSGLVATISANVIFGAAGGTTQQVTAGAGNTLTLDGVLASTNSISVSLNNTGTFVLNGANTYTGTTLWNNSSTTIVGNAAAFGTSALNFNAGNAATIKAGADLTGANKLTNSITFASNATFKNDLGYNLEFGGPVSLSGTQTLTANTGTTTFSGVISGASVTLAGTNGGKFVFSGANTYTGGTTVTSGTLILGSTATLQGATGALLVSGGSLATSVLATTVGGDFTLTSGSVSLNNTGVGSLTLASGKTFTMSGGTLSLTLGSSYDQIVSAGSGALALSGGTVVFDTSGAGFSYATAYQIFSGFGSTSFGSLTLSGYDTTNYSASISDAGQLSFSVSAIPEPSTYAACLGGLALVWTAWRRRSPRASASPIRR